MLLIGGSRVRVHLRVVVRVSVMRVGARSSFCCQCETDDRNRFLINMRCDFVFRYVQNDGKSWNPQQIHVVVAEVHARAQSTTITRRRWWRWWWDADMSFTE